MLNAFQYKFIQPILVNEYIEGNLLKCTFKTANEEQPIQATHVLILDFPFPNNQLMLSSKLLKEGVINAFKNISNAYHWNGKRWEYIIS